MSNLPPRALSCVGGLLYCVASHNVEYETGMAFLFLCGTFHHVLPKFTYWELVDWCWRAILCRQQRQWLVKLHWRLIYYSEILDKIKLTENFMVAERKRSRSNTLSLLEPITFYAVRLSLSFSVYFCVTTLLALKVQKTARFTKWSVTFVYRLLSPLLKTVRDVWCHSDTNPSSVLASICFCH